MRKRFRNCVSSLLLISPFLMACAAGDGPVVASFRQERLKQAEVQRNLPKNLSEADSTRFTRLYIEQWVREQALAYEARVQVPDVSDKVESQVAGYRRKMEHAILMQQQIRERLDTVVTAEQINAYYQTHLDEFAASTAQYQYLHLRVPRAVGGAGLQAKLGIAAELAALRSWAQLNGYAHKLDSTWVDTGILQRVQLVSGVNLRALKPNNPPIVYLDTQEPFTFMHYFVLLGAVAPGQPLPIETVGSRIQTLILNQRTTDLINAYEAQVMQNAQANNYITIY